MDDDISNSSSNSRFSNNNLKLDLPLTKLPQVSDTRANALISLGINNIRDLINYFPQSYIDLSTVSTISEAKIGFNYTIKAKVYKLEEKEPKPGVKLVEITLTDQTGTLICAAFRQKWLLDTLNVNDEVAVAGKLEFNFGFKRMTNPFIYTLQDGDDFSELPKIIPVYSHNEKISSTWIRRIMTNAFSFIENIDSYLPKNLIEKYKLMNYFDAIQIAHFPSTKQDLNKAKRSIKYHEVFLQQVAFNKQWISRKNNSDLSSSVLSAPFNKDKIDQAISAIALYKDRGFQSCMFSPASILLSQYKDYIIKSLKDVQVVCAVIDDLTSKENTWKALYDFKCGHLDAIISTTKLLDNNIKDKNLGLLIIDEKTYFSKEDYDKVFKTFNTATDEIYLTTKPLTKELSYLLYPHSELIHIPYKSSKNCETKIFAKDVALGAYDEAALAVDKETQIIIYNPYIGLNADKVDELSYKNFEIVSSKFFQNRACALINNKTKYKEIVKILEEFYSGNIDVLFCCIKPNFDLVSKREVFMIVEDADKLGLGHLFELRNFSFSNNGSANMRLISFSKNDTVLNRLNKFIAIMDGQTLVKTDLNLRKEGSTLGFDKWGFWALKLINVVRDNKVIETAHKDAIELLTEDPNLNLSEHKLLSYEINQTFGEK